VVDLRGSDFFVGLCVAVAMVGAFQVICSECEFGDDDMMDVRRPGSGLRVVP
jgi:hypothetical protein